MGCENCKLVNTVDVSDSEDDPLNLTSLSRLQGQTLSDDEFKKMKLTAHKRRTLDIDLMLEVGKTVIFEDRAVELPSLIV